MANASIFQSLIQPVRPVADYSNDLENADALRTRNALQSLTLRQQNASTEQALQERNALQRVASTSGGNRDTLISGLRNSGLPGLMSQADTLEQSGAKLMESRAKAAKDTADAGATTQKSGIELHQQHLQGLSIVNTPQDAANWIFSGVQSGALPAQGLEAGLQRLQQAAQTPEGFAQWKQQTAQNGQTIQQQMEMTTAKPTEVRLGNIVKMIDTNPRSQTFGKEVTPAQSIGVSPDTLANNQTSRANNAATVGASMANAGALRDQAQATRDAASIQTGFTNEQNLRKEFEGLPEVKNYKQAFPALAAIRSAAGRNTPQSDINLVYGIAKLYDPNSVVREGEYATVANSPSIPERIKGFAQYLAGGGKLSPETKKQILAEAESRGATYKAEVDKARGSYGDIAKRRGMRAEDVFANMGDLGAAPATPAFDMGAIDAEIARRAKAK